MIYYITRKKDKTYMIISIDEEKAFNKTYHTFMINSLNKIDRNTYKRKCSKKKGDL